MERLEYLRAVASLANLEGYHAFVEMLQSKRDNFLNQLKLAGDHDEIIARAIEFRTWDEVVKLFESEPREAIKLLKTEGDNIYG